ncbi:MAG: transcription factor FapR [Firmicutes bacterium]|nr:transcription factor FapR [Bacillota bacterium]
MAKVAQGARQSRQEELRERIEVEPFLTDEELAERFSVSVQTIRLDRLALGIPELRERLRTVATEKFSGVRTLAPGEVIGDIVDLELGSSGISVWRADAEHGLARSAIVRGHHLFAQANSLAMAIVDAQEALTAKATVRFVRPVSVGVSLVAKAVVHGERHGYIRVDVHTKAGGDDVFVGEFLILRAGHTRPRV